MEMHRSLAQITLFAEEVGKLVTKKEAYFTMEKQGVRQQSLCLVIWDKIAFNMPQQQVAILLHLVMSPTVPWWPGYVWKKPADLSDKSKLWWNDFSFFAIFFVLWNLTWNISPRWNHNSIRTRAETLGRLLTILLLHLPHGCRHVGYTFSQDSCSHIWYNCCYVNRKH